MSSSLARFIRWLEDNPGGFDSDDEQDDDEGNISNFVVSENEVEYESEESDESVSVDSDAGYDSDFSSADKAHKGENERMKGYCTPDEDEDEDEDHIPSPPKKKAKI